MRIICPDCGAENIQGVDVCAECEQSLSDMDLEAPTTSTLVEKSLLTDQVSVLDSKPVISVGRDMPVGDALRLMIDRNQGCLVVVDEGRPVGIFSERDALMKLNEDMPVLADRPVSDFMTPDPQTIEAGAKIVFALHRMDVGGYRHIPIVDRSGRLVGMLSVRDILKYLAAKMMAETP